MHRQIWRDQLCRWPFQSWLMMEFQLLCKLQKAFCQNSEELNPPNSRLKQKQRILRRFSSSKINQRMMKCQIQLFQKKKLNKLWKIFQSKIYANFLGRIKFVQVLNFAKFKLFLPVITLDTFFTWTACFWGDI